MLFFQVGLGHAFAVRHSHPRNPRRLLHPPALSLSRQPLRPGRRLFPGDDCCFVGVLCRGGDSEAVYLVRGSVLLISSPKQDQPEKPDRRDRPEISDGPDPRHAPRNVGLLDLRWPSFLFRRLLDKALIQRRPSYQIDNCFLSCNVRRGCRMTRRI